MENNKKNIQDILINVAILLLGLLGSAFFESITNKLIDSDFKFVVIVSVIGLIIIIITTSVIKKYVENMSTAIHDIAERVYPTFELISYDDKKRNPYLISIELLKKAHKFVALDILPWGGEAESDIVDPESDYAKYYQALNEFIERGGSYTRIYQFKNGKKNFIKRSDLPTETVVAHLNLAIQKMSGKFNSSDVTLLSSDNILHGVSFILIDDRYISWEISDISVDKTLNFSHDIFLDDPKGKTVFKIIQFLRKIQSKSIPIEYISKE